VFERQPWPFGLAYLTEMRSKNEWWFGESCGAVVRLFRGHRHGTQWMLLDRHTGETLARAVCYNVRGAYKVREIERMNRDLLKRGADVSHAEAVEMEVEDNGFSTTFPVVAAFVLLNIDEQGELRERASVRIFAEGGQWKACLQDPNRRASLYVTVKSPGEAFKALEKALGESRPDWRRWKEEKAKAGKR
jgi:hypothetical protein